MPEIVDPAEQHMLEAADRASAEAPVACAREAAVVGVAADVAADVGADGGPT